MEDEDKRFADLEKDIKDLEKEIEYLEEVVMLNSRWRNILQGLLVIGYFISILTYIFLLTSLS